MYQDFRHVCHHTLLVQVSKTLQLMPDTDSITTRLTLPLRNSTRPSAAALTTCSASSCSFNACSCAASTPPRCFSYTSQALHLAAATDGVLAEPHTYSHCMTLRMFPPAESAHCWHIHTPCCSTSSMVAEIAHLDVDAPLNLHSIIYLHTVQLKA